MTAPSWSAWAHALLPHVTAPAARVLIDGRSGSGKSTLAAELVTLAAAGGTAVQCVHLEDVYPGWDGLAAASQLVVTDILRPLRDHGTASWPTYDWHADGPGPVLHAHDQAPLLVEGAGVLTQASATLATFTIWLDASADLRQARAFARDGDLYRPHWHRWAAQEDEHLAREHPQELADLVIDVNPILDPAR